MTLLTPQFINTQTYTAKQWRAAMANLGVIQPGIWGFGDMVVSAGAGMTVNVAAGSAWVLNYGTGNVGWYHVTNDAPVNVAVTAANGTNPRIDQLCLRIPDSVDGGATPPSRGEFFVQAGTATTGATLANRTGTAAPANNALRLADILVPAASGSISGANIRDRRPWARGAALRYLFTGGDFTNSSSTPSAMGTSQRIEFTGLPVKVSMWGCLQSATALQGVRLRFQTTTYGGSDSTFSDFGGRYYSYTVPVANVGQDFSFEHEWTPPAGSYLVRMAVSSGTGGVTVRAGTSPGWRGLYGSVIEQVMASAGNGAT